MLKLVRHIVAATLILGAASPALALDAATGRPILTVSGQIANKNAGNAPTCQSSRYAFGFSTRLS